MIYRIALVVGVAYLILTPFFGMGVPELVVWFVVLVGTIWAWRKSRTHPPVHA